MDARTTTLTADPARIDDGLAFIRDEVMPMLQGVDGFVGLSVLVDRMTGRCIVTAAWQSREAMTAAAPAVAPSRRRAAEAFGAGVPQVAEWEIAVMHRTRPSGEGACTRVVWGWMDPGGVDRAVDTYAIGLVPRFDEIPGFCSCSLLVDRENGRCASAVTYASRRALEASRDRGAALRHEFTRSTGAEVTEIAEFELAFAHLRVPATV